MCVCVYNIWQIDRLCYFLTLYQEQACPLQEVQADCKDYIETEDGPLSGTEETHTYTHTRTHIYTRTHTFSLAGENSMARGWTVIKKEKKHRFPLFLFLHTHTHTHSKEKKSSSCVVSVENISSCCQKVGYLEDNSGFSISYCHSCATVVQSW